eukprot:TRINITY_DN66736_c5_g1_i1.p1 TRINITY_DN66736_c5_g1~~TRINITY_DN66736_c5_g1_i1.p1  ORF type:complete len:247 (+),score=158.95 TRINITY_DN66736_c5_g1_i1:29-769(+)
MSLVKILVTHSVLPINTEKRVDPDVTVGAFKDSLYMTVGTAPEYQSLQLQKKDGTVICELTPDDRTLASFGVSEYAYVHVVDTDPNQSMAEFQDVSKVEKYEISEEAYDQRKDTFRKFKQRNLREYEEEQKKKEQERAEQEAKEAELAQSIKVGQRCEVIDGKRRGEVKFVGGVDFKAGVWIGIKLDEPTGKNDGAVKGKRYFEAGGPKYGLFTRPSKIRVGDYPEKDPFESSDDDDDDDDVMTEL